MSQVNLQTDRLLLRRWRDSDHRPFAAMCADPEVMRYIGDGSIRTTEQASADIRLFESEWDQRGFGLFAVEEKRSENLIGFTGFSWPGFLPEVLPAIEIGWRLSRQNWGKGYASEAARAALAFCVSEAGIRDIVSIAQGGNLASVRIMQKLGMLFDRRTVHATLDRELIVYRLPQNCWSLPNTGQNQPMKC